MNALAYMQKQVAAMEADVEKIMDARAKGFSLAIRLQLLEWQKRFPRHTFTAWEGHGLLSFEVSPPVMGEKNVDYLTMSRTGSGVLADLAKEAIDFIDLWNKEFKVCPMGDTSKWSV